LPSLSDTVHALVAEVEITSPSILTEVAIALGVSTLFVDHAVDLLKIAGVKFVPHPLMQTGSLKITSAGMWAQIYPLCSPSVLLHSSPAMASLLVKLYELHVAGVLHENNSSLDTMTNMDNSNSYKPVTLTMKGKLKPSTLTKVARKKSSQSSGKYVMPATMNLWDNPFGTVTASTIATITNI
jgi:hypothetical protein